MAAPKPIPRPFALYYGNANNWNYATGNQGNFGVESPAITAVPGKPVWVTFDLYLQTSFLLGECQTLISTDLMFPLPDDSEEMLIWSSADPHLSGGLPTIQGSRQEPNGPPLLMPPNPAGNWRLRFRFETIDGSANLHAGAVLVIQTNVSRSKFSICRDDRNQYTWLEERHETQNAYIAGCLMLLLNIQCTSSSENTGVVMSSSGEGLRDYREPANTGVFESWQADTYARGHYRSRATQRSIPSH